MIESLGILRKIYYFTFILAFPQKIFKHLVKRDQKLNVIAKKTPFTKFNSQSFTVNIFVLRSLNNVFNDS